MSFGPLAGLQIVDVLTAEQWLPGYYILSGVRGGFRARHGRFDEAHANFERAASFTRNAPERALRLGHARAYTAELQPPRL